MTTAESLIKKEASLAVIGLGYVGLPIALKFAKKINVIGFDINERKVALMKNKIDPSNELSSDEFEDCSIAFTTSIEELKDVQFFIVAVPTPIDQSNYPDLGPLLSATETVAKVIKKGDIVVFESTVYPGCTEEDCVPILEKISGLTYKKDFFVGYSPERINPGDKEHTLENIIKVVAGCTAEAYEQIAKTYEVIVQAGIYHAPSIKVAEAAKIIENTQRDVNIALINELSMIFNKLNINTYDVLEAAGTKWNFLKFSPGLVGGHCIGVDPYYLTYKANKVGYHSKVITSGRYINDSMGSYIAKETIKKLLSLNKNVVESRILVMGITFKENVTDIRNSKVIDVIEELKSFSCNVEIIDPLADKEEVKHEYHVHLSEQPVGLYDAIILAVNHEQYTQHEEEYFKSISTKDGVLVDVKGIYKNKIKELNYWSL